MSKIRELPNRAICFSIRPAERYRLWKRGIFVSLNLTTSKTRTLFGNCYALSPHCCWSTCLWYFVGIYWLLLGSLWAICSFSFDWHSFRQGLAVISIVWIQRIKLIFIEGIYPEVMNRHYVCVSIFILLFCCSSFLLIYSSISGHFKVISSNINEIK